MKFTEFIFTFIFFYIGWFGSVFLAKTEFEVVALVFPVFLMVFLYIKNKLTVKSFLTAIFIAAIGVVFDFYLVRYGLIQIYSESVIFIPIWLLAIWLLFSFSMIMFALNLNVSTRAAILMGAIGGPLSYKSGEFFKVLIFLSPITPLVYAVFWGILFPLALRMLKRSL